MKPRKSSHASHENPNYYGNRRSNRLWNSQKLQDNVDVNHQLLEQRLKRKEKVQELIGDSLVATSHIDESQAKLIAIMFCDSCFVPGIEEVFNEEDDVLKFAEFANKILTMNLNDILNLTHEKDDGEWFFYKSDKPVFEEVVRKSADFLAAHEHSDEDTDVSESVLAPMGSLGFKEIEMADGLVPLMNRSLNEQLNEISISVVLPAIDSPPVSSELSPEMSSCEVSSVICVDVAAGASLEKPPVLVEQGNTENNDKSGSLGFCSRSTQNADILIDDSSNLTYKESSDKVKLDGLVVDSPAFSSFGEVSQKYVDKNGGTSMMQGEVCVEKTSMLVSVVSPCANESQEKEKTKQNDDVFLEERREVNPRDSTPFVGFVEELIQGKDLNSKSLGLVSGLSPFNLGPNEISSPTNPLSYSLSRIKSNDAIPCNQIINPWNSNSQNAAALFKNNSKGETVPLTFIPPSINSDGSSTVLIPHDVILKGSQAYFLQLYGYFVGLNPHFKTIEYATMRMWKEFDLISVTKDHKGYYFFKFSSERGMEAVLEKGPWIINGAPIFLKKWIPGLFCVKPEHKEVPMWVKVHNVPLECWNSDALSHILSGIGKPLKLDSATTERCLHQTGKSDFVRALIEVSAESNLKDLVEVKYLDSDGCPGEMQSCRVEYQSPPRMCSFCKIFGHATLYCNLRPRTEAEMAKANELVTVHVVDQVVAKGNEGFTQVDKKKNEAVLAVPKDDERFFQVEKKKKRKKVLPGKFQAQLPLGKPSSGPVKSTMAYRPKAVVARTPSTPPQPDFVFTAAISNSLIAPGSRPDLQVSSTNQFATLQDLDVDDDDDDYEIVFCEDYVEGVAVDSPPARLGIASGPSCVAHGNEDGITDDILLGGHGKIHGINNE